MDKLYYSIPTIGIFIFILGIIGIYHGFYPNIIYLGFSIYFVLMALGSLKRGIFTSLVVFIMGVITHFAYGIGWLKGIFSNAEKDEKVIWNSR